MVRLRLLAGEKTASMNSNASVGYRPGRGESVGVWECVVLWRMR